MKFATRRIRNIALLIAFSALIVIVHWIYSISLTHGNFRTGWLLLLTMLFLASYNVRKKLPFIPLGKSSVWLQFHIFFGLLAVVLFLCHLRFQLPNGRLEVTLAFLFVAVAGSGIIGLILSRTFARRLTTRGEEVLYERIPAIRKQLTEQVELLALGSISESNSTTVANFYIKNLGHYFSGPRHFFSHLCESHRPYHELMDKIKEEDRYLNDKEREILDQITEFVEAKYDLDYRYALQSVLKRWLFLHIPLTYGLLIVSVLHAILANAFFGGIK